jgi:hypothetical protein
VAVAEAAQSTEHRVQRQHGVEEAEIRKKKEE